MSREFSVQPVRSPSDPAMDQLCESLAGQVPSADSVEQWPAEQLSLCGRTDVYRWFMPEHCGGFGWSEREQTEGYLRLSAADLTTTFVITQRMGACRRIAGSDNTQLSERWLPGLLRGETFATVGISHLTTSRRHETTPVLLAEPDGDGYVLSGYSPWVTGGAHANVIVMGATLPDSRQLLAAVPVDAPGVHAAKGTALVALSASCTDRVELTDVRIGPEDIIAGPVEDVMSTGVGGAAGGVQTSTLAIGLSKAAIAYLILEASKREDLRAVAGQLEAQAHAVESDLMNLVDGTRECSTADLRGRANRLVLRSTQAALTAAKGAGFVQEHPVGRWCREALFFLVWSCPQPIAQAHLCELAGIGT